MELKHNTCLQGNKYRIERVLGQGSFGITYLATARFATSDSALGSVEVEAKVTIKEFFMSDINSRGADGTSVEGSAGSVFTNYRRRFRKEAENLSRLAHPNIVKVYDVFDENDTTYYVMEYIDGETLDSYITRNGVIEPAEAARITMAVGGALSYMHSCKMLHLDVKPKNVMRRRDDGRYFLIDFGLSKFFTPDGVPETSTTIGLGTPGYAPIEQSNFRQDGAFPATLDVYALGATMYKMLTGQRPPEASEVLNNGLNMGLFPDCPMADITAKAMAPVKKDRYPTIDSLVAAVRAALPDAEKTIFDDDTPRQQINEPAAQRRNESAPQRSPRPNPGRPNPGHSAPRQKSPAEPATSKDSFFNVIIGKFKRMGWFSQILTIFLAIIFVYVFFRGLLVLREMIYEAEKETPIWIIISLVITLYCFFHIRNTSKLRESKWLRYLGIAAYLVCWRFMGSLPFESSLTFWFIGQCILALIIYLWYLSPDGNSSARKSSKSA